MSVCVSVRVERMGEGRWEEGEGIQEAQRQQERRREAAVRMNFARCHPSSPFTTLSTTRITPYSSIAVHSLRVQQLHSIHGSSRMLADASLLANNNYIYFGTLTCELASATPNSPTGVHFGNLRLLDDFVISLDVSNLVVAL